MLCDPLALARKEGLRPLSFSPLVQRPTRLVVKLETEQGVMVLKADTAPEDTTWDARNIALLAAADVPLQQVIAQGEDPLSYIILSWIEGEPLTGTSPLAAQQEAGRLLYRIHHLENRPPYERSYSWDSWMEGWLNAALPWWEAQDGVETQNVATVWRGFTVLRPLLATRGHHYMLQDGRPDHFLVRGERIVGLIDVHDAQAGDAAMDLGVFGVFDEPLLHQALQAYGADAAEREALRELLPFYIFLRRLAAAEWHARHGSPEISRQALAVLQAHPWP